MQHILLQNTLDQQYNLINHFLMDQQDVDVIKLKVGHA